MCKICQRITPTPTPYITYNDFPYSSRLCVQYVGQCVNFLHKIAYIHVLEYTLVMTKVNAISPDNINILSKQNIVLKQSESTTYNIK